VKAMISVTDAVGFVGGVIGSICAFPQLILMFRTKSAKEISIMFAILYFVALTMQATYCTLKVFLDGIKGENNDKLPK